MAWVLLKSKNRVYQHDPFFHKRGGWHHNNAWVGYKYCGLWWHTRNGVYDLFWNWKHSREVTCQMGYDTVKFLWGK